MPPFAFHWNGVSVREMLQLFPPVRRAHETCSTNKCTNRRTFLTILAFFLLKYTSLFYTLTHTEYCQSTNGKKRSDHDMVWIPLRFSSPVSGPIVSDFVSPHGTIHSGLTDVGEVFIVCSGAHSYRRAQMNVWVLLTSKQRRGLLDMTMTVKVSLIDHIAAANVTLCRRSS